MCKHYKNAKEVIFKMKVVVDEGSEIMMDGLGADICEVDKNVVEIKEDVKQIKEWIAKHETWMAKVFNKDNALWLLVFYMTLKTQGAEFLQFLFK